MSKYIYKSIFFLPRYKENKTCLLKCISKKCQVENVFNRRYLIWCWEFHVIAIKYNHLPCPAKVLVPRTKIVKKKKKNVQFIVCKIFLCKKYVLTFD